MKDFKLTLGAYASGIIVWTVLICTAALMIANIVTIYNIHIVIDTIWHEIAQVKDTNISLYQFIEAHKDDFN
jgi:hypothetical protein|tara:strand:- start:1760 stop:1975 length:216 start_codon:yes stop_codon:yes gene_type:complete